MYIEWMLFIQLHYVYSKLLSKQISIYFQKQLIQNHPDMFKGESIYILELH